MTPFPILNDKVQLTLDAPAASDAVLSGLLLKADDTAVRAAISGGAYNNFGLLFTPTGQLVYTDATAGLPANSTYVNGLPCSPTGELCVSSGAVATYSNGIPFAANGAVCALFGTPDQQVAAIMAGFAGPKVWYDYSDLSTLQQDSAGTTPVAIAGDPIGRVMDKSGAGNHSIQATAGSRPLWQTTFAAFDGVDDNLASAATIDFTSTDKLTMVLGVRRLSDAADEVIVSFGVNVSNGSFYMKGPGSGMVTKFEFLSRGTAQSVPFTSSATYNAPITAVATGIANIAAPVATLRLNGVQVDNKVVTQGTGNYANNSLYTGKTSANSQFFNGNFYTALIIGRLLTAPELVAFEQYTAGKCGIVI